MIETLYDSEPFVAWDPELFVDPGYSSEDMRLFKDTVLSGEHKSHYLAMFIDAFIRDPGLFCECLKKTCRGESFSIDDVGIKPGSVLSQKSDQKLFHLMYETPLEKVPLYVNEESFFLSVIKWRLRIAK